MTNHHTDRSRARSTNARHACPATRRDPDGTSPVPRRPRRARRSLLSLVLLYLLYVVVACAAIAAAATVAGSRPPEDDERDGRDGREGRDGDRSGAPGDGRGGPPGCGPSVSATLANLAGLSPGEDLRSGATMGPHGRAFRDDTGHLVTLSRAGTVDLGGPFFRDLGTNGRRCVSCHVPSRGWTITPGYLQDAFERTSGGVCDDGRGLAAVFRPVDGATSPTADTSTEDARRVAYKLLLARGLVRVGLPVPPDAEFELVDVDDPYHFASAQQLSLFRRPLPTTNLQFDSTVMWDGREVVPGRTVESDLIAQASTATVTHAQGQPPSDADRMAIVTFEMSLATTQAFDRGAGDLRADGALGGPAQVLATPFYVGINDNFGDPVTGKPFSPIIFSLYDRWAQATGDAAPARRSIARGQALFNGKEIQITGVGGINDEDKFGRPEVVRGTCGTCHDTPGGGNHSVVAPLDIGIADAGRRSADVPLYTLRNKATGEVRRVTDPGRALVDGRWAHVGRFKGPMLRDLAARAPYFHDGSAADLAAVVDFYDGRFSIDLSPEEKLDLVAFLRAL